MAMKDRKLSRLLRRFEDAVLALSWVGSRTGDDGPEADPDACRAERAAARAALVDYVLGLRRAEAEGRRLDGDFLDVLDSPSYD